MVWVGEYSRKSLLKGSTGPETSIAHDRFFEFWKATFLPIESMYGISTYVYHKNQIN